MKKTIISLKTVALLIFLTLAFKGQSQCAANFLFTYGPNGNVTFTSSSTTSTNSPTTYYWNFGNNTTYSNTGWQSITATTYTANGTYTVTLFILSTSPTCSSSIQYTLNINNAGGCPLNPLFGYTQGSNGLVNFTNFTTGTVTGTTFSWNFGDSSPAGSGANPTHTYGANGQYTVTMIATTNGTCLATYTDVINVNSYCIVLANYSYSNSSNGVVNFQSTSTGTNVASMYKWIYGDGGQNWGGTTASHTYVNGTYLAILVVTQNTAMPTCVDSVWKSITVTNATCNLVANWTVSQSSGGVVQFINNSTGTTSSTTYSWNFGNGQVSNQSNPTVTYPSGGVYYVTMYASNGSNCNSSYNFTVNVTSISCVANANFTMTPTSQPQHWNATPSFPWNISQGSWTWGDGSPATGTMLTSHQYSAAGMYTICLTVTATCGATATACSSYSVYKGGPNQSIIYINVLTPPEENIDGAVPTGIQRADIDGRVRVYPNPTNGDLNLSVSGIEGGTSTVEIYSLLGNLVYRTTATPVNGELNQNIDLKNSANGIYVLKISTDTNSITRKIVVEK